MANKAAAGHEQQLMGFVQRFQDLQSHRDTTDELVKVCVPLPQTFSRNVLRPVCLLQPFCHRFEPRANAAGKVKSQIANA